MKKTILSSAVILLGAIIILFVALVAAMSLHNAPLYAWRVLRYGESEVREYDIFPARTISHGSDCSLLPGGDQSTPQQVTYRYDDQIYNETLNDFLTRTETRAFLVVKDDQLIFETYLGSSRQETNTSFSVAKSFASTLIGAAIADGHIGSVDDPVIQYIPEIVGRGLDSLTIHDLLLMNSGIRYLHNDELPFYRHPFGDDAYSYYSSDMRKIALRVQAGETPIGAAFRYNNYHILLEGMILERATGMPVAEYLQERIWKPIGAQYDASWSLDSTASGFEKMESGINARAVDYARFGLLFLHNGNWNGVQILPESWVIEATTPLTPDPRGWETMTDWPANGGYYKYHWWGLYNQDGSYDFFAHGKYDQIIYVAPRANVVVVRFGSNYAEEGSWPLFIQAMVDQMMAQQATDNSLPGEE